MKYKINISALYPQGKKDAWELAISNLQMIKAILAVFEAGDIALTEDAYNRLSDDLKSLFKGVPQEQEKYN